MGKVRLALALSVALNLFLAAALIAGYVSLRTGGRMINAGSLRIVGAELPAAVRKPFRVALRETRRSMRPPSLLQQPVVDQAAVLAALGRARSADMEVRAAVEQRAVSFAATLSKADRTTLADAMRRRADRIPKGGR